MTKRKPLPSERSCIECGAIFAPQHHQNVACSVACRHERHKRISREHAARKFVPAQPNPERPCKRCGQAFIPYRQTSVYCGRRCAVEERNERRAKADRPGSRSCHKCGVDGLPSRPGKPVCDSCKVDPRPNAKAKEAARRLRTYGLTQEQYDALWERQGRRCAVCNIDTPPAKGWCIDHDHLTGKVRGILCSSCNLAIGLLDDSIHLSMRVTGYLMAAGVGEGCWGIPTRGQILRFVPRHVGAQSA